MVSLDPRRLAQTFLTKKIHLRHSSLEGADPTSKQEFLDKFYDGGGQAKVRNPSRDPEVRERNKEVSFDYAYHSNEEFRREVDDKYERWKQDPGAVQDTRGPVGGWSSEDLSLAIAGEEIRRKPLSEKKRKGRNESFLVTLKQGDRTGDFVFKPAKGEDRYIRPGMPAGTYHSREHSAYAIDALLGGDRGVVPPTVTRGPESGSYQAFAYGTSDMYGDDMNRLASAVKPEDLPKSADFNRLQVLDLILGHEDRHAGNLLFHFDGEASPENLRLSAIDNGLTLSSPLPKPEDHRYDRRAFHGFYYSPDSSKALTPEEVRKYTEEGVKARKAGDEAIARSLSNIPKNLQDQIKSVSLEEMANQIIGSGIHEKGAVRAALVRMAALQEDPEIFAKLLKEFSGNLEEAWTNFQYLSGQENSLLEKAGASGRSEEIDKALEKYQPNKWEDPPDVKSFYEHHLNLQQRHHQMWAGGGGGKAAPDPKTRPSGSQKTERLDETRKPNPGPIQDQSKPPSRENPKPQGDPQRTEKLASLWLYKELK
jgi:hypothetical protein